jgi:hypothetical protein
VPNWMERAKTNLGKTADQRAAIADETLAAGSLDNSPSFPPVDCPATVTVLNEGAMEFFEERAAVAEYDAGLSREDAEAQAREATERHKQKCRDRQQKVANYILSLPTWVARQKELERYRQQAIATYGETAGNIIGREMAGWIRFRGGLISTWSEG